MKPNDPELKNIIGNKLLANEAHTRKVLMQLADQIGCRSDLQHLFVKYDNLLKGCTNEKEAEHIKALAVAEIHQLMNCQWNLAYDFAEKQDQARAAAKLAKEKEEAAKQEDDENGA